MSTTATKRTYREALTDATAFRDRFATLYERWEIAGSVRRGKSEVGDIEHVVIPKFGEVAVGGGLFAQTATVNLVWHELERLAAAGQLQKHVYGATGFRWGEKYRGVDFNGFNHEIFCADADNFGPTLAIRTGPAEFSQRLVVALRHGGMCNKHGKVWRYHPCACGGKCPDCEDGDILDVSLAVPDEREYFKLCGLNWIEPKDRL